MVRERYPTFQERRNSLQSDSLDCPSYAVDLYFRSLVKYRQESQIPPPTWRGPPKQEGSHISPQDSPTHIQLPQPVTDTYKLVYISHQARRDSDSGERSPADSQGVDIHPGPALRKAHSLEHLDFEAAGGPESRKHLTHPQIQDVLSQIIFIITQHYSHISSYICCSYLHPHFKMQSTRFTTQAGT